MPNAVLLLLLANLPLAVDVPLARFDRVAEGVYRSAQPTRADFRALQREYGLKSVLKLNHGSDDTPPGIEVHVHPLNGLEEPSKKDIEQILDVIDAAPKPILIHCSQGQDRTGLVVALYRIRHGESADSAYADMVGHGFRPWPGLWRYWTRAVGWRL